MMADYLKAFEKTLKYEGGYTFQFKQMAHSFAGISRLMKPGWVGWECADCGVSPTEDMVKEFLYFDVWCPLWCHMLRSQDVAWALFDFGLTSGTKKAVNAVQDALWLPQTGVMNCQTFEDIESENESALKLEIAVRRVREYSRTDYNYVDMIKMINRAIDNTIGRTK